MAVFIDIALGMANARLISGEHRESRTGSSSRAASTSSASGSWVGTWTGAPQLTETANLPPAALSNEVLRQVVHVSLGGSRIRVKFSNEFGNGPLTIHGAHVAVCRATPRVDSTIDTTTDAALSFSGAAGTTIAQGAAVWSDPLDFNLASLSNLTVTIAFGSVPMNVTGHPGSRTTSYEMPGGTSLSASAMTSALTTAHWYILDAVDVIGDAGAKGLAILGDSITDGRGSNTDGNDRWPDDLAVRMHANTATADVGVMNQGMGGNAVTNGGLGPPGVQRFSRDILGASGVRYVIVFGGVNDIGAGVAASAIASAYASLISQAHAQHLFIYGATITPFGASAYYSVANEATRQAVNMHIKSGPFDAFIDFDAVVTDNGNPPRLRAQYDSGDGLHLNAAGYRAMAAAIDLTLFTR
jgi:lysophospholipase L1-like esterase